MYFQGLHHFFKEKSNDLPFCVNTLGKPIPQTQKGISLLMNSITYLLSLIQFLYQQNCWLITFICKYIPLKQWAFDDSHSPKYQKFRTDELLCFSFIKTIGTGSSSSLTSNINTIRRFGLLHGARNAISLLTVPVPPAMLLSLFFIVIMVPKDS